MADSQGNICFRCGKVRVVVKTYKEYIGNSLVVTALTSCPDPECQAVIDKQLEKEQKFREDMKIASEKRLVEAKERKAENALRKV
jgi:hypothetical protein